MAPCELFDTDSDARIEQGFLIPRAKRYEVDLRGRLEASAETSRYGISLSVLAERAGDRTKTRDEGAVRQNGAEKLGRPRRWKPMPPDRRRPNGEFGDCSALVLQKGDAGLKTHFRRAFQHSVGDENADLGRENRD